MEALLKEHAPAIFDVCRYTIGPRDAEDVAQAALMKIVRSIDKFDPEKGSFRTWALTVTRNLCRDRLRRRGLEIKHFVADGESATEWTASGRPSPERVALARIESRQLMEALESLPEGMKMAVSLYHLHGASYEEIAATLEVPKGTVMTWLHRGRKRLREALGEGAGEQGAGEQGKGAER